MASITKRGNSYRIVVYLGYDLNGKQLRPSMTWTPPAGLTERQIEKEVQRQAVLFEEKLKHAQTQNGKMRFTDFIDLFLDLHARPNLKRHTLRGYEQIIPAIRQALGHLRLENIKPGHIASFYANLQEAGIRSYRTALPKIDFSAFLKEKGLTMASLSRDSGISLSAFRRIKKGCAISIENAEAVAAFLSIPYDDLFVTQTDDTPLSPGTVHTYHRVLSTILSRAVDWEYIDRNPALKVKLPERAYPEAAHLDEPDALRLLEHLANVPINKRTLITFDLLSGLRRAELLGLRWSDIDFSRCIVHVRQTWNYVPGAGCYVDTPKTRTGERSVKISAASAAMLLEYRSWQSAQRDSLGDAWKDTDDRVFTYEDGGTIFPDSISHWFSDFMSTTDVPRVTIKSLRHTYASMMIAKNVPIIAISHQLGHAQPSTTTNIYGHAISSAEAAATQVFSSFDDAIFPQNKEAAGT